MDPISAMFWWAVVWAIVGLITTAIWGLDVPKFIADAVIFLVMAAGPIWFIASGNYNDIDKTTTFLESYISRFIEMLPGVVIGDVVGTLFAPLFGLLKE